MQMIAGWSPHTSDQKPSPSVLQKRRTSNGVNPRRSYWPGNLGSRPKATKCVTLFAVSLTFPAFGVLTPAPAQPSVPTRDRIAAMEKLRDFHRIGARLHPEFAQKDMEDGGDHGPREDPILASFKLGAKVVS